MTELRIGFLPLTDAAVLVAAAERGFAGREGLTLRLEREASWATLRDRLALGFLDAAHLLAPLALAMSAGLGPGPAVPLVAPFALNLNGNAVTLSRRLWDDLRLQEDAGPVEIADALGAVIRRRAQSAGPVTLATVFPFSTHTILLNRFLRMGGVDPARDVRLTVVPPPHAVAMLRTGVADGFCVGSPWNSVAVAAGHGRIVALGSELIPDAPEKVLAWRAGRFPDEAVGPLVRALRAAGAWCADPGNWPDLAGLLAEPRHLGVAPDLILQTLEGRLSVSPGGSVKADRDYLRLGGDVHRPRPEHAAWICDQLVAAGLMGDDPAARSRALAVYRPDLFEAA